MLFVTSLTLTLCTSSGLFSALKAALPMLATRSSTKNFLLWLGTSYVPQCVQSKRLEMVFQVVGLVLVWTEDSKRPVQG